MQHNGPITSEITQLYDSKLDDLLTIPPPQIYTTDLKKCCRTVTVKHMMHVYNIVECYWQEISLFIRLMSHLKLFNKIKETDKWASAKKKKWPQAVFLYTNQGKWLFIVLNVIKVCGIYCYINEARGDYFFDPNATLWGHFLHLPKWKWVMNRI